MPPPRWMAYIAWDASGEVGVQVSSVRSADHAQLIGTSPPERSPMWRSTYCSIPEPIAPPKRNVMGEPTATPVAPAAGETDMNATPLGPPPGPPLSGPIMLLPPPQAPPTVAVKSTANPPIHLVIEPLTPPQGPDVRIPPRSASSPRP